MHTGRTGSLEIKRAYYTCTSPGCGHTEFPLDRILGISPNRAAGKFEEKICWLSAHVPFERVSDFFRDIEQMDVDGEFIRTVSENCGSALLEKEESEAAENSDPAETARLYVETDGSMVPVLSGEDGKTLVEYKENKLALLFCEEDIKYNKDRTKCDIMKKKYVTSLGRGVEHFERLTRKKASSFRAAEVVYVTDGAEWIDQMRLRLHRDSVHILDWYHASEHLWECGRSLFGEKEESKVKEFVSPLEELLWNGRVSEVCTALLDLIKEHTDKETEIRNLYSYYYTRRNKMQYAEFRAKGYFIGSGAVESANKYLIQQRLKQAGMKWLINGAHSILKLREKIYEGSWKSVWSCRHLHFSYK